jgi:hypothetical protein
MKKILISLLAILTISVNMVGVSACNASNGDKLSEGEMISSYESSSIADENVEGISSEENSSDGEECSEGLLYDLSDDRTYCIVSGLGYCADSEIVIPSMHKNLPVKEIGARAFFGCNSFMEIIISDSVTRIGEDAFGRCSSLTKIVIPNSVISIGEDAFWGCINLTDLYYTGDINDWFEITFEDITSNPMGYAKNSYFNNQSVKEIVEVAIPDTITEIKDYTFVNHNIKTIIIPNSVVTIGEFAFAYFEGYENVCAFSELQIETVYYMGNIEDWCKIVFKGDGANPYSRYSNLYINNRLATEITEIVIPNTMTEIGAYTFEYWDWAESVVIPEGVTRIGEHAFYCCSNLVSIAFEGTIAEWNAIEKGNSWNDDVPVTEVICSDGMVSLTE